MKKTMMQSLKVMAVLVLLAVATQSMTVRSSKPPGNGYALTVVAGDISPDHNCGTYFTVYVKNATDIITTGTAVYEDVQLTIPLNFTIISQSGATMGQTFYVVNGIVGGYATPC
jgi:hypothetical protein